MPSPEDVEADVALEVNVGMINHCFTLHLGRVMWVTLSHLAPEKRGMRWEGVLAVPQSSPQSHVCTLETHLKAEHELAALVEALEEKGGECIKLPLSGGHPRLFLGILPCFTLTSSGQITSLKLRRSSGSEKLMSHVLGRFSSLMSRFGQQGEGEKTGKRKEVGLDMCQQNLQGLLLDLRCSLCAVL